MVTMDTTSNNEAFLDRVSSTCRDCTSVRTYNVGGVDGRGSELMCVQNEFKTKRKSFSG